MANPSIETENLSLTVTLAGRPYPLRVLPEDEESIRRIAKELNDKVASFQQTYPGKDKQDCLAMLLLIYAVDLYKVKEAAPAPPAPDPELLRGLADLERQLAGALAPPGTAAPPLAQHPGPRAVAARGDRDGYGSDPGSDGGAFGDSDDDQLGFGDDRIELVGPDGGPA